jgi:hypothetical protein
MPICPHCYRTALAPLAEDDLGQTSSPERVVPFAVAADRVQEQLNKFAKSFRFTPQDLQAGKLATRLRHVYVNTLGSARRATSAPL